MFPAGTPPPPGENLEGPGHTALKIIQDLYMWCQKWPILFEQLRMGSHGKSSISLEEKGNIKIKG